MVSPRIVVAQYVILDLIFKLFSILIQLFFFAPPFVQALRIHHAVCQRHTCFNHLLPFVCLRLLSYFPIRSGRFYFSNFISFVFSWAQPFRLRVFTYCHPKIINTDVGSAARAVGSIARSRQWQRQRARPRIADGLSQLRIRLTFLHGNNHKRR